MNKKILHLMVLDKFIPPFINFIQENFEINKHKFVLIGKKRYEYGLTNEYPVIWLDERKKILVLLKYMYNADKIIIHGLWSERLLKLLFLQPWLLKKCYWVMWGGDFYFPEKQSWIKKQIIKKMGNFITYIKGDYELVQKWYGANGELHKCFMYLSNLYKEYNIKSKIYSTINIQVGNSADPTNNHIEILQKLIKYRDENIKIYVPLSYGNEKYAKEVIEKGKELFGDKFIALIDFMPFDKYLDFLSEIDIAIFNHNRQQAMGNIITLLGLGKKVYIRSDITPWEFFKDIEVKMFDVKNIELELIEEKDRLNNQLIIKKYFSEENYLKQLQNLF